jgi:hypothetical protein
MVKHSHVPILKIRDRNLPAHTQKRKEGSKHRLLATAVPHGSSLRAFTPFS